MLRSGLVTQHIRLLAIRAILTFHMRHLLITTKFKPLYLPTPLIFPF